MSTGLNCKVAAMWEQGLPDTMKQAIDDLMHDELGFNGHDGLYCYVVDGDSDTHVAVTDIECPDPTYLSWAADELRNRGFRVEITENGRRFDVTA